MDGSICAEVRVDERLAGVYAQPESDLVQTAATALQLWQRLVDSIVGDQAAVDAEEAVGTTLDEPDLAARLGRETNVVAIAPGVISADRRQDRRIGEATDAAELFADNVLLEDELALVGEVLPVAAAARTKVGAGRFNAVRRRRNDFHDASERDACAAAIDFDDGCLAGDSVVGEDHVFAIAGQRAPFERHIVEGNSDSLRRVYPFVP